MNYGSEPADQVVRYSLEGAEFALRISGTAAKNFFIFAQAVLHDSKKTHGKTHLIRLLKEQKGDDICALRHIKSDDKQGDQ